MRHIRHPHLLVAALLSVPIVSGCAAGSESLRFQATIQSLQTEVSSQSTEISLHLEYLSYLATRVPPPLSSPASTPIPTPFVVGSVGIAGGTCCLSAIAGQSVRIPVAFQASSPAAPISDFRVRAGLSPFDESDLSATEWQPFTAGRDFEYIPPLNWSAFYVTVQFRDALGNLSPVYSTHLSVEGRPAPEGSPSP
jgi:hypothetical protein